MNKIKNIIEIEVRGQVNCGKTEILQVIKNALINHFGPHTQVASVELSMETALGSINPINIAKTTNQTAKHHYESVFILTETNVNTFKRS